MFTNEELRRIFYALREDNIRREQSSHANMMEREIDMNMDIMSKIRMSGITVSELNVRAPNAHG